MENTCLVRHISFCMLMIVLSSANISSYDNIALFSPTCTTTNQIYPVANCIDPHAVYQTDVLEVVVVKILNTCKIEHIQFGRIPKEIDSNRGREK